MNFDSVRFRLVNRSEARVQGGEFRAEYAANADLAFGVNLSYLSWGLVDTTQPLRNIPHANGGVQVDWRPAARLRTRFETQWIGRRYDFAVSAPGIGTVGGYSNTNVSADYSVSRRVGLYVRADNLFDAYFHEYIGFPNPGASVRLGVRFHAFAN